MSANEKADLQIQAGYFGLVPEGDPRNTSVSGQLWPIPFKKTRKCGGDCFPAGNQSILNSSQVLVCKLTSSSVGRNR